MSDKRLTIHDACLLTNVLVQLRDVFMFLCGFRSSVDPTYIQRRVGLYLILGIVFLGAGAGVTVSVALN